MTTLLAWATVVAAAVAALALGQSAHSAPGARRVPRSTRVGLVLSRSGPVVAVLVPLLVGWASGAWVFCAVTALALVVVTAVAGVLLAPL